MESGNFLFIQFIVHITVCRERVELDEQKRDFNAEAEIQLNSNHHSVELANCNLKENGRKQNKVLFTLSYE